MITTHKVHLNNFIQFLLERLQSLNIILVGDILDYVPEGENWIVQLNSGPIYFIPFMSFSVNVGGLESEAWVQVDDNNNVVLEIEKTKNLPQILIPKAEIKNILPGD